MKYVSKLDQTNSFTVVVEVNKETKETTEVATYTQDDVKPVVDGQTGVVPLPNVEVLPIDDAEVVQVVEYIESSNEIAVNKIKTVISAEKSVTVFGTEVIKVQGLTDQNVKFETVVTLNPDTEEIEIDNFEFIDQPNIPEEIKTEFNIDVITGTKVTFTNNPTVLASSEIMQEITKKVQTTDTTYQTTVMTSSATTEYPEKVKVVSLFKDETTNQAIEVISLFDKKTSEVTIVETKKVQVTQVVPTIKREIFTPAELPAV